MERNVGNGRRGERRGDGRFAAGALALALAFVGCAREEAGTRVADDRVPLGYVGQFSNPAALALMNHVVREINEAGGVTLDGVARAFELVPVDHGGSVEGAVAAMHDLADRGVSLVLDPPWSSMIVGHAGDGSDGATRVAVERDMLILSGGATSPLLTTLEDEGRVFRTVPSDAVQGAVGADHLRDRGIRSATILYRDDAYGRGLSEAFRRSFEASGGEILALAAYSPEFASPGADFSRELDAVFAGEPEAILLVTFDELYDIANQIHQGAYLDRYADGGPVLFGTDGPYNPAEFVVNLPEPFLERFSGTIPGSDRDSESYELFLEELERSGIEPDAYDGPRYDAAFLLALAVQAAQSTEASAVKAVLGEVSRADPGDVVVRPGEWAKAKEALLEGKTLNYEGASGAIEFDDAGDRTEGVILLWEYYEREGRIRTTDSVPYDLSE